MFLGGCIGRVGTAYSRFPQRGGVAAGAGAGAVTTGWDPARGSDDGREA
jgi:hypothetical protein